MEYSLQGKNQVIKMQLAEGGTREIYIYIYIYIYIVVALGKVWYRVFVLERHLSHVIVFFSVVRLTGWRIIHSVCFLQAWRNLL